MPRWRSIWLVARREILERGRSRGFILSVAVHDAHRRSARSSCRRILFGDETATKVGVVEPAPAALGVDHRVDRRAVRPEGRDHDLPDARAAADAALEADDGRGRRRRCRPTCPARARSASRRSPTRASPSSSRPRRSRLARPGRARREQRRPGGARRRPAAAGRRPRSSPQTEADQARFLVANIGAVLILVGIFSFGFTVLTGVVEEKQSRVVEVVLSTVRARDLLMGKVLGIGVLGIVQLVVFVVAALVAALATDRLVAADDDAGGDRPAGGLVRPRLPAVLDRARASSGAGLADGGGLERLDAGDDGRDDQLLRGDLRGRSTTRTARSRRSRRSCRRRHRSSSRCGPPSTPSRRGRSACPSLITLVGDLGAVLDRRAGLRGRGAPGRRPDEAARRVAVGRGVTARGVSGRAARTARASRRRARRRTLGRRARRTGRRATSPASALAV